MQSDAVEPGAETGVAVESTDVAEDLDEDLLSKVGGVDWIVDAARNKRVERQMILRDEKGKGPFRAGLELGDEGRVLGGNAYCGCEISHCCARLHIGCPLRYDFHAASGNCELDERKTAPAPAECSLTLLTLDTGGWGISSRLH